MGKTTTWRLPSISSGQPGPVLRRHHQRPLGHGAQADPAAEVAGQEAD